MAEVLLTVRSQMQAAIDQMDSMAAKGKAASSAMADFGQSIGDTTEKQIKKTETMLGKIRGMGSAVAKGMSEDFKAMLNLAGFAGGLKMGKIFGGSIKETFELTDAIRKLGGIFGIAQSNFISFQTKIVDGLASVGLGADVAVQALKGLSETQVRGEDRIIEYAKALGMLASITGQKGQEAAVAKGVAETITAGGGDVNDTDLFNRMIESLRKSFNATGQSATAAMAQLSEILESMPDDLRKKIGPEGLINLQVASATGGQGAPAFLKKILSKSYYERQPTAARGFSNVFTNKGLDVEKFKKQAQTIFATVPGDNRLAAQTLGLSEEEAEGFVRLYESIERVGDAQERMRKDNRQLEEQYKNSMTAMEAFSGSLNKFKSSFSGTFAAITNTISEGLVKAMDFGLKDLQKYLPKSLNNMIEPLKEKLPDALNKNLGSTAVVGAAVGATALMLGGGLKGLGKSFGLGKGVGVAEKSAYEQITGEKVIPVYVTNASEIGMGSGGIAAATGGMGALGKAGAVAGSAVAGYAIGSLIRDAIKDTGVGKGIDSALDSITGWIYGLDKMDKQSEAWKNANKFDEKGVPIQQVPQLQQQAPQLNNLGKVPVNYSSGPSSQSTIIIDVKNRDLKATIAPNRGTPAVKQE